MKKAREAKPFKRATMLCNGRRLPVMGCGIHPSPIPPPPRMEQFKPGQPPQELCTKERKAEAGQWLADAIYEGELRYQAAMEEWRKQVASKPRWDVKLEIILLGCVWRGGYVGEWKPALEDLKAGQIGPLMELEFADGTKIPGSVKDLPAAETNAQKALLDEERGAGVGDAELRAIAEQKEQLAEVLGRIEQAAKDANRKPGEREWWGNLWAAFDREPGNLNDGKRWRGVAKVVLAGVWENAGNPNWASAYLWKTTFRRLAEKYRNLNATRPLMRDKLWTLLDRQWTAAQEKEWGEKLRRYAERERDKVKEKTAEPKKPA